MAYMEKETLAECIERYGEESSFDKECNYTQRELDDYKSFLRWLGKHKLAEYTIQPTHVAMRVARKHGWSYSGIVYRAHLKKNLPAGAKINTKIRMEDKYLSWTTSLQQAKDFAASKYMHRPEHFVILEARTINSVDIRKAYDEISEVGCCDFEVQCRLDRIGLDEDEVLCIVKDAKIIEWM